MGEPIRVVIADDHPLVRDGVRESLIDRGMVVVAEAEDAPGAVAAVLAHGPDVCLLDIEMPGGGIEAAKAIAAQSPGTAVVMLTVSDDERDLLAAVRAGALGYLLKETDPDRLALALEGVLTGEAALPRRLTARVLEFVRGGRDEPRRFWLRAPRGVRLTEREWEILELLETGLTTAAVAERLSVSPVTVRRHVSATVAKLGVADRDEALALVRHLGAPA
jgi:DNA-binding NarL/FixJ family response regulator